MGRLLGALLAGILSFASATCLGADGARAVSLPLEDVIKVDPQAVPFGKSAELLLPALPQKAGKIIVLRFGAVAITPRPAGCNFNASLKLNGAPVTRRTAGGRERLIGRPAMFQFPKPDERIFQVFSGSRLMLLYGPDVKTGNGMTRDGMGAAFLLDISDLARGVDGNTLTIENTRSRKPAKGSGDVLFADIELGWLDKKHLPKPKSEVPKRGPIAQAVSVDGLELAQAKGGGFAVRIGKDAELRVETALGMDPAAPPALVADDVLPQRQEAKVTVEPFGSAGHHVRVAWPRAMLDRTVEIRHGLVVWRERWTNAGDKIAGIPFRHRLFLQGEMGRFLFAGDPDVDALAGAAQNPTVFVGSRRHAGHGFGVTAESDWLRLLMWLRARGGVGEIYSETLALAPGASIDFELTITPVADGGGYWTFINALRRRWGVNGVCIERPLFWGYARANGKTPEEMMEKSLGHLGPIYLTLSPWQGLGWDAQVVRSGKYPRLAPDAPRAPGKCPDLDIDAYLTFRHRETGWARLAQEVEAIHRACPSVKVVQISHPAMEVVYRPLVDRWPFASQAIRTPKGGIFEVAHYTRAHLHDSAAKDWGVQYFVPRPGSEYLMYLMESVRRSMDECKTDGLYCDEFSWANRSRHYSRYDYSRWDGRSADLDSEGNVVRLKSDGGHVTESCQLQMTNEVLRRGKFFLGNGAAALRSVNELPVARFIEGGNGCGTMAGGHLSTVPLVLGNMGDRKTTKGVFESVKCCLSIGCIYSPAAVNLLLDGPDNFVCKLYPITVREIGPGRVVGEERLIATVSGDYDWPGRDADIRLYRYDADGKRMAWDAQLRQTAGRKLTLAVPKNGLVIAEICE